MTKLLSAAVSDQHALIFQAWQCILGSDRHAIYVSGPITTGPRFIAVRERGGADDEKKQVLAANIADIVEAAARLRKETGCIVIEPGSLSVQTWSQDDYLELWTNLIERHIAEVRFLDGWEASIGCALEYERARQHGVTRCRLDGSSITDDEAISLVSSTAAKLAAYADDRLAVLGRRLSEVAGRLGSF